MLDFAAALLAELERWMLTASPAMVDLNTFLDTSDKFVGPVSVVEEVQRRLHTDEVLLSSCSMRGLPDHKSRLLPICDACLVVSLARSLSVQRMPG